VGAPGDQRLARADLTVLGVAMLAVSTSGPMIAALTAPALAIAFWRNAMGAAAIGVTAVARPSVRAQFAVLTRREITLIVVAGALLAGHFMCWTPSLTYTSVASATALVCVQPVWAALGSRLLGRPVSRRTWTGIGLSLAGVLLLTGADLTVSGRAVGGDALAIVGGMLAAAYTTVGEEVRRSVSTVVYTTMCYATCALATLVVCLVAGIRMLGYDGETWFRLVALTVAAQLLGHTMFNRVVGRVGATVVSTAILLEVPMAAILAAIFLDQSPPGTAVPAGALLLAGVFVVVRAEGRAREEQPANLPVD
jgi:drug/metabolite transporter (DMT)-like permease